MGREGNFMGYLSISAAGFKLGIRGRGGCYSMKHYPPERPGPTIASIVSI
jgi:hypothetical protein